MRTENHECSRYQIFTIFTFFLVVIRYFFTSATRMTLARILVFDFGLSAIRWSRIYRAACRWLNDISRIAFFANLRPVFVHHHLLHLSEQIEIKQIFLTEVEAGLYLSTVRMLRLYKISASPDIVLSFIKSLHHVIILIIPPLLLLCFFSWHADVCCFILVMLIVFISFIGLTSFGLRYAYFGRNRMAYHLKWKNVTMTSCAYCYGGGHHITGIF